MDERTLFTRCGAHALVRRHGQSIVFVEKVARLLRVASGPSGDESSTEDGRTCNRGAL